MRVFRILWTAATALLASFFVGSAGRAQPSEPPAPFPALRISFQVAEIEGTAVVDEAWIAERVQWANTIFNEHGVSFASDSVTTDTALGPEILTRADRDSLANRVQREVINCFVVASLKDVDVTDRFLRGVHWQARSRLRRHYVILSRIAGPTVLAHELGHFLGNHQHSNTPGNLMSYERGDGPPFLDDRQVATIRRHAAHFIRTRELVARPSTSDP